MPQASRLYSVHPGNGLSDTSRPSSPPIDCSWPEDRTRNLTRQCGHQPEAESTMATCPTHPAHHLGHYEFPIVELSENWWMGPRGSLSWHSDTLGNAAHTLGSAGSVVSGAQGSSGDRERGLTKARTRRCPRSTAWPTPAPSGQFVSARCSGTQLAKVACCGWQAGKRYGGGVAAKLLNWAVCLRLDGG